MLCKTCIFQPLQGVITTCEYIIPCKQWTVYFFQQMQLPSVMPTLVLGLTQYTCMLLAVLAEKQTSLTALKLVPVPTVCGATQRMLE